MARQVLDPEVSMSYRYHPEGEDLKKLCKLLEETMPEATFGFKFEREKFNTRYSMLRLTCWSKNKKRYFEKLLKTSDSPESLSELFLDKCGSRLVLPSHLAY